MFIRERREREKEREIHTGEDYNAPFPALSRDYYKSMESYGAGRVLS